MIFFGVLKMSFQSKVFGMASFCLYNMIYNVVSK